MSNTAASNTEVSNDDAERAARRAEALAWLQGQLMWERTLAGLRQGRLVPVPAVVPVRDDRQRMAA